MLRAFVEVDRATMGPERLAAKLTAYARLYHYVPAAPGRHRPTIGQEPVQEEWRRRYPLFPRLLFVLDGTGPAGITIRIRALHAAAVDPAVAGFLHAVPVAAASLADLRNNGPSEPMSRPIRDPDRTVLWSHAQNASGVYRCGGPFGWGDHEHVVLSGRPQRPGRPVPVGSADLALEHRQLVPQDQQFDVLGRVATSAGTIRACIRRTVRRDTKEGQRTPTTGCAQ